MPFTFPIPYGTIYHLGRELSVGRVTFSHDDQLDANRELLAYCKADVKLTQTLNFGTAPQMTDVKLNYNEIAIATFTNMLNRATAYRNGDAYDSDLFNPSYGICDNIRRCIPDEYRDDEMSGHMAHVKDNVIRRLPSYSGNYHYPVRAGEPSDSPDDVGNDAENAYDCSSNKWDGDYGGQRHKQLVELLGFISCEWSEELIEHRTPCDRVGIVKHETVLIHKDTKKLYVLDYDDDSSMPYFKLFGREKSSDNRECIDLNLLKVISANTFGNRSVKSFLKAMGRNDAEKAKLNAKILMLQNQLTVVQANAMVLEVALKARHGVKRAA